MKLLLMPLLYGLGARDFVELQGYVLATCQKCGLSGPFAVYHAKRKVTFYSLPTVSVREHIVIECRACTQRFGVPPEMRDQFAGQLMNEAQVAARMRQAGSSLAKANGVPAGPTYYQVLQVDPAAEPEVIEAAFRRLALKYHPDTSTNPNASARMRDLLEAKNVLSDPAKRRAYDRAIGFVQRPPAFRSDDV
jgi:hypothetical protein